MIDKSDYIEAAKQIIISLGLPRAQQNERSTLCLLALLNLTPGKAWTDAENPLMGITPIMDWAREHYDKDYAPNTRETVRRQTMHQFCDAGIARYNPDRPDRPVNSPKAVYQIEPAALHLIRTFGTSAWHDALTDYLAKPKRSLLDTRRNVCTIASRSGLRQLRRSASVRANTVN